MAIIGQQPINKGSREYYQQLYDSSKYIYVGRITLILSKTEQLADSKDVDSELAYVTVSKGWKNGKVKKLQLKLPEMKSDCTNLYQYKLKEKKAYVFFESQRELIHALPLDKYSDLDELGSKALTFLGESDWYYARNSDIHYSPKN